jgi:hypothetical protein
VVYVIVSREKPSAFFSIADLLEQAVQTPTINTSQNFIGLGKSERLFTILQHELTAPSSIPIRCIHSQR